MKDNKYSYGREIIFELRACHAISAEVYLHWLEKIDKEEQLSISRVVGRSGQLNIEEHQESVIKSLNDLKKRYPNKTNYRISSNCGTIQYFVDNELVYDVNI